MQIIKIMHMVLAFVLELCMFFSISYWGFMQGKNTLTKWSIAIVCFAISVILWGVFAAPKSQTRLSFPMVLVFELSMFLIGSFLLYKLNFTSLSLWFAFASIISVTAAYILKQ